MIEKLEENHIFVFGSNTAGQHGAGAARQAYEDFGAKRGVGEGRTGQTYAFPTLDSNLKKRTDIELVISVVRFFDYAKYHPELTFLLTKVGTGLAGYKEWEMKWLFRNAPENVIKPEGW